MAETEKTVMGIHFKVFRQHLEFLHLQTEQFVESTGTFPMHGAVRTSSDESERRPLLPLVEMDQVELQLADLLSADGGLQSELASKAFLKRIQAVSLDCHKMLCITILKQTKTQPALSAFTQGDGFRVLGPWLKSGGSLSFKLHIVEFLASSRLRLEKRADKETQKFLQDTIQAMVEISCKGSLKSTATDHSMSPRGLTPEQATLRVASLALLKRLRSNLDMQASSSLQSMTHKKKAFASDVASQDRPVKRPKIDTALKPLATGSKLSQGATNSTAHSVIAISSHAKAGGGHQNNAVSTPTQQPGMVPKKSTNSIGGTTPNTGAKASTVMSAPLPQAHKSPFASFSSDKSYAASAPQLKERFSSSNDDGDSLRSSEYRRRLRWADDGGAADLCLIKEFFLTAPPCADVDGLDDADITDKNYDNYDNEEPDEYGRIDIAIDPRQTHNLVLMKKKEHESERQLLEQARKLKNPDPVAAVEWIEPRRRHELSSDFGDGDVEGQTNGPQKVEVNSKELKIQKIRQSKKEEVFYLLTTEIPDNPDHVPAPISGNVRMPTNIPWEAEYFEEVYIDPSAEIPLVGVDEYSLAASYDRSEVDDGLSEILAMLPASVLALSPDQLTRLMELIMEGNNADLLEDPDGVDFRALVDRAVAWQPSEYYCDDSM